MPTAVPQVVFQNLPAKTMTVFRVANLPHLMHAYLRSISPRRSLEFIERKDAHTHSHSLTNTDPEHQVQVLRATFNAQLCRA